MVTMGSSTPQTELTNALASLEAELSGSSSVATSLSNAAKAKTLKAAQASIATGQQRLVTAEGTLATAQAAWATINTPPPPPLPSGGPNGPTGSWNLVNDFEFPGTTLPPAWVSHTNWTGQNGVTDLDSNISVANGSVGVTCSDPAHGAAIQTVDAVVLPDYCYNFHALFPANNWNAVWGCTLDYVPASEYIEFDNAEFLNNKLSCTTHDPTGVAAGGSTYPPGVWTAGYHDYTVWRNNGTALYYWDGTLVKTSTYEDSGAGMFLIITAGNGQNDAFQAGAQLLVASAKVWAPA